MIKISLELSTSVKIILRYSTKRLKIPFYWHLLLDIRAIDKFHCNPNHFDIIRLNSLSLIYALSFIYKYVTCSIDLSVFPSYPIHSIIFAWT